MALMWYENWLIGANGVFCGCGDGSWCRIGRFDYHVNAVYCMGNEIYVGVNCGIFKMIGPSQSWVQLHDETVTEVLAIAPAGPGVIVGCPYGIATAVQDENGAFRWTFHSDSLSVNQRFTTALLPLGTDGEAYLVGTEGGLLVFHNDTWERTNISGSPVRAILFGHGMYWAGTDTAGIWTSPDGATWRQVCKPAGSGAVFDLAATQSGVLAATSSGFLQGEKSGAWIPNGPGIRAACVAADAEMDGHWLGGAYPGGLWMTENAGMDWRQCGNFIKLMSITARAIK